MRIGYWVRALLLGCSALSAFACERRAPAPARARPALPAFTQALPAPASLANPVIGDATRGRELVQRFECNRCHDGTGFAAAPLAKNCFSCHERIMSGRFPVSPEALARFRPHVASAQEAPSLIAIGARLQGQWIRDYLLAPRDLRPNLVPTMPRLALDARQASDIVAYLIGNEPPELGATRARGNAAHGRELMDQKGCTSCHAFNGVPAFTSAGSAPPGSEIARSLAPDLRFTRARFRPDVLRAWLLDPKSLKSDTRMPNFGLAEDEAADISEYIVSAQLEPEARALFVRLPVLTRRVSFEEANQRVFSRTCHHCHTDAEAAGGDGGPGNTGGFGFAPRGISFSSHASILAGYVDEHGQRRSLFEPLADGTPRLIGALLSRHDEARQLPGGAVRGMPLGLPPLSAEDIQLVESWVAQGKPL